MKLSNSMWLLSIALAAVAMAATGQVSKSAPQQFAFQGGHPMPTGGGGGGVAFQGGHPMPTGGGGGGVAFQGGHPMPTGGGGGGVIA